MARALPAGRQKAFDDFYRGASDKDAAQIRAALTDDFTFRGPMMAFDEPDSFVRALLAFDGRVTDSQVIVDGDRLAHLYVLDVGRKIPMCDIIQFRGDKFSAMRLYTDSKLFEPDAGH